MDDQSTSVFLFFYKNSGVYKVHNKGLKGHAIFNLDPNERNAFQFRVSAYRMRFNHKHHKSSNFKIRKI